MGKMWGPIWVVAVIAELVMIYFGLGGDTMALGVTQIMAIVLINFLVGIWAGISFKSNSR